MYYFQVEADYSRWQLMDKPISLGKFNALPHLTPAFFEYSLRSEYFNLCKNLNVNKIMINFNFSPKVG